MADYIEAINLPLPRPHEAEGHSLRSGGSQLTLTSQWESRKVRTSPLAMDAPRSRVRISPSLFLVRRILTLENRAMYSSSFSFKCSGKEEDRHRRTRNISYKQTDSRASVRPTCLEKARILEWGAISSSRGSSQPRNRTCMSYIGRWILYH